MALSVDEALRKLAPLRPADVARWKRQLPYLDEKTRRLVEWKVLRTASEALGDIQSRLLLSCPPRELCAGELELGRVAYDRERWPFSLRKAELLQHLAVFGRSGSGKTNVVLGVLKQLGSQRVPVLIFDWKRTFRHALPALGGRVELLTPGRSLLPFRFNPFLCPPGVERHVHITLVVDLLGKSFTLGDGAKSILHRVLSDGPEAPSVAELLNRVEGLETAGRQGGWKASAVRCLQTLIFLDLVRAEARTQADTVQQFFARSTVLELNGLNENAKRFLIPAILNWVYQVRLASPDRERLHLVVVLEEAHHVLGDRQSEHFFGKFLRQCRELGIGIILVDQAPSLLSSVALGNCFATLCLNLKDPDDIRVAGGLLQMNEKERPWLSRLPVGRGVVKLQDRWRQPFVVQFPHVNVDKGFMTDDRLRLFLVEQTASSGGPAPPVPKDDSAFQLRLTDAALERPAFEFLLDVMQYPDAGVRERYGRLGWSVDKGNRVKQQLLITGLIEAQLLRLGNTRRLVVRATNEGRKLLGLEHGVTIESIAHEFWKRRMAQKYSAEGWAVEVEGLRNATLPDLGRADLVLTKGTERWAVEVETGKSDVVKNARAGLKAGLSAIIVVPTDGHALEKVERLLATEGLLGFCRISISPNGSSRT